MTQEQIDMRMHPERFAAPKDPAIEQAKAIDLAERQGRGAVDAMARKFMRNGLSPAQAYAAAFNSMPTTNPANQGAVPSLPGMDPMRIAGFMGAGPGMAAGQYGVGMERAGMEGLARGQESRDRLAGTQAQADATRDVGLAQAGAASQDSLIRLIESLAKLRQGDQAIAGEQRSAEVQRAMDYLDSPQAEQDRNSTDPSRRLYHQGMRDKALGGASGAGLRGSPPANQPGAPSPQVPSPQAPLSSAFGGNRDEFLISNPQAMAQHLAAFPTEQDKLRERAMIYARAGKPDPSIDSYLHDWVGNTNSNLVQWWPDWAWANDNESLANAAAKQAAARLGVPENTALGSMRRYYGLE